MDRALEWWSRRPLWLCAVTLATGWLFLGGLGPLVMIPLAGMSVFPPVYRAMEYPGSLGREARELWRQFKRGFEDDGREQWPDRDKQREQPCPASHEHHHESSGPAMVQATQPRPAAPTATVARRVAPIAPTQARTL